MRLIWYQRPDLLWNADCTCGATICGIALSERADCEVWHFAATNVDRSRGNKRLPCGPKMPESHQYLPELIFP